MRGEVLLMGFVMGGVGVMLIIAVYCMLKGEDDHSKEQKKSREGKKLDKARAAAESQMEMQEETVTSRQDADQYC